MDDKLVELISKIVLEKLQNEASTEKEVVRSCKIPVGVSARHVHLTQEHLDVLFGDGYKLRKKKDLMGGQFAAEESVTIVGSKLNAIEKVRILGPLRSKTQIEVSKSDAVKLGLEAPVRESGSIEGSAPITIIGPKGSLYLKEGCIVAKRHIHMSPEDAKFFGVVDNEIVCVKHNGERGGIFTNVQIRVDKTYTLEMHIDTDEANGMGIKCGTLLDLIKGSI